jgi:hypothetical protein
MRVLVDFDSLQLLRGCITESLKFLIPLILPIFSSVEISVRIKERL